MSKTYRGASETPGKDEYEAIDLPDECPVCEADLVITVTDGGRDQSGDELPREFDTGAAAATDALVETHGPEGALTELRDRRRSPDTDTARAHEALAYLKFAYEVPA